MFNVNEDETWPNGNFDALLNVIDYNYKSIDEFCLAKQIYLKKYSKDIAEIIHSELTKRCDQLQIKSIELILNWKPTAAIIIARKGEGKYIELPTIKAAHEIEPCSLAALFQLGLVTCQNPARKMAWYQLARILDQKGMPVNPFLISGSSLLVADTHYSSSPKQR